MSRRQMPIFSDGMLPVIDIPISKHRLVRNLDCPKMLGFNVARGGFNYDSSRCQFLLSLSYEATYRVIQNLRPLQKGAPECIGAFLTKLALNATNLKIVYRSWCSRMYFSLHNSDSCKKMQVTKHDDMEQLEPLIRSYLKRLADVVSLLVGLLSLTARV